MWTDPRRFIHMLEVPPPPETCLKLTTLPWVGGLAEGLH